jgi:diguanylate cyclase (GGDEF)-like protein
MASDPKARGTRVGPRAAPVPDGFLKALTARYARSLPGRIRRLKQLLNRLRGDPNRDALVAEVRKLLHQLKGTAGSYGFRTVAEHVRRLEDLLRESDDRPVDELDWARIERSVAEVADTAERICSAETHAGAAQKARLLLVDDDPDFVALARDLGRRQLIDVVTATSGSEALRQAETGWLDGAILDVWLGAGDSSFELAQKLRELPGNEELPIAFTSADVATENRVAAAQAGAALFLPKPLTESKLEDAAQQLVTLRHAARAQVLLVDDDRDFLARAAAVLNEAGLQVHTLSDPAATLPTLERLDPDALLLDVAMPDIDGLDLCRILRTSARWQDLPIVIMTASDDAHLRIDAFRAGCDDYMVKPIDDAEFTSRIKTRIERRQLMRARLERDPLTALPLRRSFMERLRSRIAEAQRHEQKLALCLLDIDHFKAVNDTYGHLTGDRVLSQLGRLLSTELRSEDLRARWGGEEFALAFPGQSAPVILRAVEQLLEEFYALEMSSESGETFHAAFSAGIAEYPTDGETLEELLRAADVRLYQAKEGGRHCVVAG